MTFYKSPFLYITPLLIAGVLLGSYNLNIWLFFGLLLVSISVLFLSHVFSKFKLFSITGFCSILFLGIVLGTSTFKSNSQFAGTSSFIVVVKEFNKSDKNWNKAVVEVLKVRQGKSLIDFNESILLYFNTSIHVGDVLLIKSNVNRIENKGNPGEFDAQSYWEHKGIQNIGFVSKDQFKQIGFVESSLISSWLMKIRESFSTHIETYFDGDTKGVAKAILLGDKSSLSIEARNSFSNAGAMHVLAVSGLHVGIVMYLLMFLLSKMPKVFSKRSALIATICVVWLYAAITGFSPSVMRASLMFTILLAGQFLSKQSNSVNVLFVSAFILLLFNPFLVFDLGFQFSYLAVLGILLLQKPISKTIYVKNKFLRKIWEGTAVGISAQIFTFPLVLFHFHQFPNYFLISNIVVMAFAAIILLIGLLFILTKSINVLTSVLAIALGLIVNWFLLAIQFIDSLPGAVANGFDLNPLIVAFIYLCIFLFVVTQNTRFRFFISAGIILIMAIVQYDRYNLLSEDHIVIFNHNEPLIGVKVNDNLICLYSGDSTKISRVIQDYNKLYPGNIRFQSIAEDKNYSLKGVNKSFAFSHEFDNLAIDYSERKLLLKRSFQRPNSERMIVSMPYLPETDGEYNLRNGAILILLE